MKRCKDCGEEKPAGGKWKGRRCWDCHKLVMRVRSKKRYQEKREEILAEQKERYAANKDAINQKRRDDYAANLGIAEKARQNSRNYLAAHRDKINAKRRAKPPEKREVENARRRKLRTANLEEWNAKRRAKRAARRDIENAKLKARRWANIEQFRKRELERYRANPEPAKARMRSRYWANREQYRSSMRANYLANPESYKARNRIHRKRNPMRRRELHAAYRDAINQRRRDRYASDSKFRQVAKLGRQRRRARKAGVPSVPWTETERDDKLKDQNNLCRRCGKTFTNENQPEIEHIMPYKLGGWDVPENRQLLCQPCNASKKDSDPIEDAQRNGRLCYWYWLIWHFGPHEDN